MNANIGVTNGNGDVQQTLVVVFLRGGADGLTLVPPVEEDAYHRSRPRIRVPKQDAVRLDGLFGLHPLLRPLERPFRDGHLAIVHAAGSEDDTRSHFDAQDFMEHGGVAAGGWLGRFLRYRDRSAAPGPLAAIALGKKFPLCLRGAPSVTVLESMADFSFEAGLAADLGTLYAAQPDALLAGAARDTLRALERIERLRTSTEGPRNGAVYGPDAFSQGLRQTAQLIRARVGLEAVSLDLEGWDSHFTQATVVEPLMRTLALGLQAFYVDLGADELASTTVVVMTEFGRRVQENSSFGTDHGRGGAMFVMGGWIQNGSRVAGKWPGISPDLLTGPGDLEVANNYRDVLAPALARMGGGSGQILSKIFPDYPLHPLPYNRQI